MLAAASTADKTMKVRYLQQANAKLDVTRLLVRLAKDCKCLPNSQYLAAESKLHEAGKMLGGWLKSLA